MSPYQTTQAGPYLYDSKGNLVWSGFASNGGGTSHGFHVCPYEGSDHLCFFTGAQMLGFARGLGLILDSSYSVVESVQSQAGNVPNDQHEFNVLNGGRSALITIYEPLQYDLSAYGITSGIGWIMDCSFQEIEMGTNKVLFKWSSLDHVDLTASFVAPNSTDTSGTGLSADSPWDYFHINSIDKNADGDYLVSGRHTSTIYKLSGKNGSILWQLGGDASDFTFASGLNFSSQHDARFISENKKTTVISLFDNASNGYNQSAAYSSGIIISINHTSNSATLLERYIAPGQEISASQGNMQILPSGNAFLGWGSNAWVSEHLPNGDPVLQAYFATTGAMNYRAYKFNWTATPTDAPAAYVYAHNTTAPTTYYMSWNGATEVSTWRIYTSADPSKGFQRLAKVDKNGFETIYTAQKYQAWSIIEAVAANGSGLANTSSYAQTFVPSDALAASCSDSQCPIAKSYSSPTSIVLASRQADMTVKSNGASLSVVGHIWEALALIMVAALFWTL